MYQFVYWLKAAAVVLITNSHYGSIWPIPSLAAGGHLGNCIYFFLSGFCLYHIRESFPKWYAKRIIRIYPVMWIAAAVNFLVGDFKASSLSALVHCFIYPTWYHFIGSIMVLYILYYVIRWLQIRLKIDIRWVMLGVLLIYGVVYLTAFDRSYYHIDDVSEKWVRFQFLESMLLGALLREKYESADQKITRFNVASFLVLLVCYFGGKVSLSQFESVSQFQCFLPVTLVLLVYSIAVLAIKLEKNGFFASIHGGLNKLVVFVSTITLEIYVGQSLVIKKLEHLSFPVDFVLVTGLILVYAWMMHQCSSLIQNRLNKLLRFKTIAR